MQKKKLIYTSASFFFFTGFYGPMGSLS